MIASFSKGDYEGFVEECNALIAYEESKKNYGLANRMRKALEGKMKNSTPLISSLAIAPLETKPIFYKSTKLESKAKGLVSLEKPITTIENVIFSKETEEVINNLILQWEHRDELKSYNLSPQNRILFYGPPGTGKTFAAHGIANRLGLEVACVRFDSLVSSYLGETGSNLREVFDFASSYPCVLLLDELDAIGKKRDDNHELGELKRIVISLLQNLDFFPPHTLLIACTNHEHLLDPALWRRFDCHVPFTNPGEQERKKILKNRIADRNVSIEDNWINFIADISQGLSAANLVTAVDNGIRKWVINKSSKPSLLITEEILQYLRIDTLPEKTRVEIAEKLRNHSRVYSLSYLSKLLLIPKSTLHKRLKLLNE